MTAISSIVFHHFSLKINKEAMSFTKEISITVPAELVRTTTGLSMDFGKYDRHGGSFNGLIDPARPRYRDELTIKGDCHGNKMLIHGRRRVEKMVGSMFESMLCYKILGGFHVRIPKVGRVWARATHAAAVSMVIQ